MSSQRTTNKKGGKRSSGKVLRTILSFLFSFLTALSLLILSVTCVVRIVFSEGYTKSCLAPEFFSGLEEKLIEEAKDYTIPTGLDTSVVDGVFDLSTIKADVEANIDNTFKIRQFNVNTEKQEGVLRANVMNFLESEGVATVPVNPEESEKELDEESVKEYNEAVIETENAVNEYVNEIMDMYSKKIKISALDYLVKLGNDYQKYFPFLMIISVLFGLFNGFLCVKVHKLPHRGLRYLVYAFGGGFIMTFTAPFVLFVNGFYNRLNITPEYFKLFIVTYVKGAIEMLMAVSGIWLLVAIALLPLIYFLRKKYLIPAKKKRTESSGELTEKEIKD